MNKKPYPRKCYLPFILYPPRLDKNDEGTEFIEKHIDMQQKGGNFVLYIGIPFCRKECKSCVYFVKTLPYEDKDNLEEIYVNSLLKDLEHWASFPKWSTGLVRAIYIGGGTGSILKTKNLKRIVDKIYELFNIAEDCEFTLEGNTIDYDEEKINYVANSHINRLSFGVQSFQPEMLNLIGTPHAVDNCLYVIKEFQNRGFENIQIDLIYNLPGQTMEIWRKDLQVLKKIGIKHFTIYIYRIHEGKVQDALIKAGKVVPPEPPDSKLANDMYKACLDIAKEMGFERYMLNHFCQPGFEEMYNYWNWKVYEETLAIGPGSYSYFDDYRLGTEGNVEKYIEYVNNGKFLISSVTNKLPERIKKERYIIFTLLYYKVDYKYYKIKYGSSFLEDFKDIIERLKAKGLVNIGKSSMTLTPLGEEWHTNVILEFFDDIYWQDKEALAKNWSLNGASAEVGALPREFWLGDKGTAFYE